MTDIQNQERLFKQEYEEETTFEAEVPLVLKQKVGSMVKKMRSDLDLLCRQKTKTLGDEARLSEMK